jgi:hypothetical protein
LILKLNWSLGHTNMPLSCPRILFEYNLKNMDLVLVHQSENPPEPSLPLTIYSSLISRVIYFISDLSAPPLMYQILLIFVFLVLSCVPVVCDSGFMSLELPSSRRSFSRTCISRWIMSGRIIPSCSRTLIESLTSVRKKSPVFFGTNRAPSLCGCKQMNLELLVWFQGRIQVILKN